jgi:NAD(P)-dependent dehydrogenase (short-subunit alcohol dehydrogenase family)
VTVRGAFLGMKHAAPIMKNQGSGTILTIASINGFHTGYGSHLYNTAKAAVIQLTKSVAMELGESGVRVNCICPTAVATPIWGKVCGLSRAEAQSKMGAIETYLAGLHPIPRTCYPKDVAQAAVWLAGDSAAFINGHILVIDGGLTCGRTWSAEEASRNELRIALGLDDNGDADDKSAAGNFKIVL